MANSMGEPDPGAVNPNHDADAAARLGEARYRTLFERAPLGILYGDPESTYLDANECMCQMLGYTRDELIGMNATDIIAQSEVELIPGVLEDMKVRMDHHQEWNFRRKDGSVFPVDVIATKFADGSLMGMIRDITVIREHELEIERMTRLYAALSQINQAIVWSASRDELLPKVCEALVVFGGMKMAWIGWEEGESKRLLPVAHFGNSGDYLEGLVVYTDERPEGREPSGTAFRTGQPCICNDPLNDPASFPARQVLADCGFRSTAAFPIRVFGQVCGTIQLYAGVTNYFREREVALMEEAATDVSFALDTFSREEARREAERLLHEEKLFTDKMVECMPGILYFYDAAGRFLRWNQNFEEVSGYSGAEIAGMHPLEFFAPADRALLMERIEETFTTGESSVELPFVSRDGRSTPYFFTGRRIDFQERTCLVGVGIDISERTRVEAALRLSEERYRNLFNTIVDPLLVFDRETRAYLAVNDSAVARYGYSHDEFAHMTCSDILVSEARILQDRPGIVHHQRKDGSIFEVELSNHNLDFSGRPACLVQARDLSEIRRTEAAMAQSARLLKAVVEGTSDAVFVKDRDGKYLMFNGAASALVGKPVDEVIGKDDFSLFDGEDALPIVENDRKVMESGEVHTIEENLVAGGVPRVYHSIKAPYRDESGRVIGVVGVSRDISGYRKLEDQLRQAQKMDAVGRLAGGIAHDFNNLLTVIAGYSDMLISNPGICEGDREAVLAIQEAAERAASLTQQLLGFSRQTIMQPKIMYLNDVIADTGKMLRRLIGEDLEFTTVLAPNLKRVKVDPGQLSQVLINLAVNARDAMPRGGTLTLETSNVLLDSDYAATQPACKPGPHVMLAMTDTGCGMTRDVLSRIFEPFFTTKEVGRGTGLGLAMVFGIVQQSGGFIHVYSEVDQGTTFRIYLPAVDEPVSVSEKSVNIPELGGAETVLLVEDDPALRGLALLCLKKYGYHVLAAEDGLDALRVAREHVGRIHVVLTDVVMPNMGGPELARELRTIFPEIRVLFTSGYTDDAVVRHGLLDARASFIQKPYTPQALGIKLRQVLDAR